MLLFHYFEITFLLQKGLPLTVAIKYAVILIPKVHILRALYLLRFHVHYVKILKGHMEQF